MLLQIIGNKLLTSSGNVFFSKLLMPEKYALIF